MRYKREKNTGQRQTDRQTVRVGDSQYSDLISAPLTSRHSPTTVVGLSMPVLEARMSVHLCCRLEAQFEKQGWRETPALVFIFSLKHQKEKMEKERSVSCLAPRCKAALRICCIFYLLFTV